MRGALTDIGQYEPPAGGYENRLDYLSASEQRAEQLCEQERYYSLYNNDVEEELYQGMPIVVARKQSVHFRLWFTEEELKRLKSNIGNAQIAFDYDKPQGNIENPNASEETEVKEEDKDEPPDEVYVPHPKFFIPEGVELVSGFEWLEFSEIFFKSYLIHSPKRRNFTQLSRKLQNSSQLRDLKWKF